MCNVTAVIGSCRPGFALGFCFFACPQRTRRLPASNGSFHTFGTEASSHHQYSKHHRASPSIQARPTAQTQIPLSPYLTTCLTSCWPAYLSHSNPWPSPASAPKPHPQHPQDRIVAFAFPCSAGNFEPTLPSAVTGNLRNQRAKTVYGQAGVRKVYTFFAFTTLPVRQIDDRLLLLFCLLSFVNANGLSG